MTAGFFSPLPPAPTGVADYSAALLAAMRTLGDVRVNDPGTTIRLYHLGNNHLHSDIYREALKTPGVAVLHDAVLHHFFLGLLPEREYVAEFVYNYGLWTQDLAESLWRGRGASSSDPAYFRYPMLRRIAERSRAVVVHNRAAERIVREHAPGARICVIPHLFAAPEEPAADEIERVRARLGVASSTTLFGVFGHLRESKRLRTALEAYRAIRAQADAALLIAGEFVSPEYERTLEPLLRMPGVIRVPGLPEREWWLHAHAVDACIGLRYPSAGETSGIVIRLMGIGKPVLVTAGEETADFPDAACLRVDCGAAEQDMLAEYMQWIAARRDRAKPIGELARAYVRSEHDPTRVARLYWQALEESARA